MCSDSDDLWFSSDTSRCVAEKKYTEQQAKKLFPQVFVPVCNPDGTYSEVTKKCSICDTFCFEFHQRLHAKCQARHSKEE